MGIAFVPRQFNPSDWRRSVNQTGQRVNQVLRTLVEAAGRWHSRLLGRAEERRDFEALEQRTMMSASPISHLLELGSPQQPAIVASVSGALAAPSALSATLQNGQAVLRWKDNDGSATGYRVYRSTDGKGYVLLAKITGSQASSFTDRSISSKQSYWYEIQAVGVVRNSGLSAAAKLTAAVPTAPAPANNAAPAPSANTVTVATRYGNELVITSYGADTIAMSQSGSSLTLLVDGRTLTEAAPGAGVFIYDRGGDDSITIDASVQTRTTITSLGGGVDHVTSRSAFVSAWLDTTDFFTGSGVSHMIGTLAGNVSKAVGAALADPKDAGATTKVTGSLWGTGPTAADVNQGGVGDCYFLSSLAAFAGVNPSVLTESAVDMGDGTYVVRFYNGSQPVYVRVSNDLSTGPYGGYEYAHPGASGDLWAPIMEKAFAYFNTGANSYNSLNGGWMGDVYSQLGVRNSSFRLSMSESSFYNMVSSDLARGLAVTVGTYTYAPDLVGSHGYTLVSAYLDASGVSHYIVRNPWGVRGDFVENSAGYANLTYAQMVANFMAGAQAVA
jgi:hypothetical protein